MTKVASVRRFNIMNKKPILVITVVLVVLAIVCAVFYFNNAYTDKATLIEGESTESQKTISIDGFSHLYLRSGTTEQDVNFQNPASNTCAMDMELQLENGEVIWSGKNLMPGYTYQKIRLNKALATGEYYNSKLVLRCIDIETGQELNGCEIVLTINVD